MCRSYTEIVNKKYHYIYRFLRFIRWSENSEDHLFFFTSQCKAEMKKSMVYNLQCCVDVDGAICSTQCECAAGMGPEAHCKHVRTLLLALLKLSAGEPLQIELTCTEKLQTFHRPRNSHTGSPLKSEQLDLGNFGSDLLFDPTDPKYDEQPILLNIRVRNETINHAALNHHICPLLQDMPPANMYAANNDHDYQELTSADHFLKVECISHITEADSRALEQKTRKQSMDKLWLQERRKRLHSSNFGRIVKATTRTNPAKLARQLILPSKELRTRAILHGRKYESAALKKYSEMKNVAVIRSGIIVDNARPYIACSADGIIDEEVLVEVKCPFTSAGKVITPNTVPYLAYDESKTLCLKSQHDYITKCKAYYI